MAPLASETATPAEIDIAIRQDMGDSQMHRRSFANGNNSAGPIRSDDLKRNSEGRGDSLAVFELVHAVGIGGDPQAPCLVKVDRDLPGLGL